MIKAKYTIKICFMCLLLGIFISGATGMKAYAAESKITDIMDLSGITRDKTGTGVVKGKYATREEFAQMLVQASSYSYEVKNTNKLSLFRDVSKKSSKAVYVQIAVSKGYMTGYLGGYFKPKKAVSMQEAVYGTLTLLGYTKTDFTGNLSDARYAKFKESGLGKNLSGNVNSKLTKKDSENLFYNLLNAKVKTGEIYGKTLDYTVDEDGKIDASAIFDKKVEGPVLTKDGWSKILSRKLSKYNVLLNDKKAAAADIKNGCVAYYSESANKVWVYSQKVYGTLENITYNQNTPQELMVAGTNYTVEKPKKMKEIINDAGIKKGALVAALIGRDDKASYIVPIKSTLAIGSWQKKASLNLSKCTILKNNLKATAKDIKDSDVIYYSKELERIWDFDKKVFGSLDSVDYDQSLPQQITVSGSNYTVKNPEELNKEIKASSIQNGTVVVALLGWDDKVSNILPLSSRVAGVNWQQELSLNTSQTTIYKDGNRVASANVDSNDILYYNSKLQTVWAYGKKVYGLIKSISPNMSSPEQAVIAGKTYTLKLKPVNEAGNNTADPSENAWGKLLRENGIHEGDNVVASIGFNGQVVDINTVEKMPVTIAGYVLKFGEMAVKNENNKESSISRSIQIVDTEGVIREFPCSDSTIGLGSIVEINFTNNKPVVTLVNSDIFKNSINDFVNPKVAAGARVLEVKDLTYSTITASQLRELNWSAGNVLFCRKNTAGEITDLIMNCIPSASYKYGLLKKVTVPNAAGESGSLVLTFDFGGEDTTITTYSPTANTALGAKAVRMEDGTITEIKDLTGVQIVFISGNQANTGSEVYRIADDAVVYLYEDGNYYKQALEDVTNFSTYTVKGYIEPTQDVIHAIIITK